MSDSVSECASRGTKFLWGHNIYCAGSKFPNSIVVSTVLCVLCMLQEDQGVTEIYVRVKNCSGFCILTAYRKIIEWIVNSSNENLQRLFYNCIHPCKLFSFWKGAGEHRKN